MLMGLDSQFEIHSKEVIAVVTSLTHTRPSMEGVDQVFAVESFFSKL